MLHTSALGVLGLRFGKPNPRRQNENMIWFEVHFGADGEHQTTRRAR
jgi:hypothetical protein